MADSESHWTFIQLQVREDSAEVFRAQWPTTLTSSRTSSQWIVKNLFGISLSEDDVPTDENGHHQVLGAEEPAAHQSLAQRTIMVLISALL